MNDAQEKTLVLIPKFIGAVSFFFSALIVWSVCRGEGKRTCYHRLLCGISIIDLSTSIWISLTSWPMPASEGFLWAVGNDMTCKTQGFFLQMSVGSSFYNVSLCVFFSLMIVFNWKEADLIEVEWLLHCIPILFALLSSFTGVFLDVYGPNPNGIWCTQRNDADAFLLYAYYLPLWMCIIIVTILCVYMWVYVSKIYKKSKERMIKMIESSCNSLWDDEKASPHEVERSGNTKVSPSRIRTTMVNNLELQTKRLKHIADQNFLYAGAFYLNWTAVSIARILSYTRDRQYFVLVVIVCLTVPLQGLPNFLVFFRVNQRKKVPSNSQTPCADSFWNSLLSLPGCPELDIEELM